MRSDARAVDERAVVGALVLHVNEATLELHVGVHSADPRLGEEHFAARGIASDPRLRRRNREIYAFAAQARTARRVRVDRWCEGRGHRAGERKGLPATLGRTRRVERLAARKTDRRRARRRHRGHFARGADDLADDTDRLRAAFAGRDGERRGLLRRRRDRCRIHGLRSRRGCRLRHVGGCRGRRVGGGGRGICGRGRVRRRGRRVRGCWGWIRAERRDRRPERRRGHRIVRAVHRWPDPRPRRSRRWAHAKGLGGEAP